LTGDLDDLRAWILDRIPREKDLHGPALAACAIELGRERRLWEHLVGYEPHESHVGHVRR
jgi:hypothetical protein